MFCMGRGQKDDDKQQDSSAKKIQNYIFKYEDLLGKGNFGQAYRGYDVNTGRQVAIKVIKMSSIKSKTSQKLLQNEIQILKSLQTHPNVLKCYDVFTSVNNCYIVTQLCEEDLQKELSRKGKFREHQIKQLVYGIYKGLEHLNRNSVVHRDIKISNIFISKNGIPKIADFGFAIKASSNFKDVNIGSPLYMSPQGLIYHQYGPKTDVWSFGVLLYELIHGQTPLQRCRTDQQLKTQILRPPVFHFPISVELKQLIERCLTVDQLKRPSMSQLADYPYIRNILREKESLPSFMKQTSSNVSTECSIKLRNSFVNPHFFVKELSYQNGLSLLHYCRLLHKINLKYFRSKILSQLLMNLSSSLCSAQFSSSNIFNEQLNKLRQVLQQYYNKFKLEYEDSRGNASPRQALAEIGRLMKVPAPKVVMEALQVLDTETKVLVYSLQHQNPDIFTKNSEAQSIIQKGKLAI